MIQRTAAMISHMNSNAAEYCLLFQFHFAGANTERIATTQADKTWNGFTWSAAGPLLNIPPLRTSTETAQTNFVLVFSAATFEWTNRIMNLSRGRLCRWWIAGINSSGNIIVDPLPMPTMRMVPGGMISEVGSTTVSLGLEDFFHRSRNIAPRTRSHFDQRRLFAPAHSGVTNDQSFYDATNRTMSNIAPHKFVQRQGLAT